MPRAERVGNKSNTHLSLSFLQWDTSSSGGQQSCIQSWERRLFFCFFALVHMLLPTQVSKRFDTEGRDLWNEQQSMSYFSQGTQLHVNLMGGQVSSLHTNIVNFDLCQHVLLIKHVPWPHRPERDTNVVQEHHKEKVFCWHLAGWELTIVQTAERMKTRDKTPLCSPTKLEQSGEKLTETDRVIDTVTCNFSTKLIAKWIKWKKKGWTVKYMM